MKKIITLLMLLTLVGCASAPITQTVLTPLSPVPVPPISPLVMNPVNFQVMNTEDVENLAAQLKTTNSDHVYFILDEADYKNFLLNLNSIDSFIGQQKTVVNLLENVNAQRAQETNVPAK